MPTSRAPLARFRMLHRGKLRRVYRAVVDGARDAQREGRPFDVDQACQAAAQALDWLRSATFDANRMWRFTRRYYMAAPS